MLYHFNFCIEYNIKTMIFGLNILAESEIMVKKLFLTLCLIDN